MDIDVARRIALGAQGFGGSRPVGRIDVRHFRRLFGKIGLLQIDSVNVIARAHYLPMLARFGTYDPAALDRFTSTSGEIFEYWGHEASFLPVRDYPLFRWRMEAMVPGRRMQALLEDHPGYVDDVEEELRRRGPLRVSDLEDGGTRTGSWWGYGKGKTALEWLFATGRATAWRDKRFTRVYDLTERVLPDALYRAIPPDRETAYRDLLVQAARFCGVGTVGDLADYYRLNVPTARPILADLAAEGALSVVEIDGWRGPTYLDPEAVRPRMRRGTALLSPFDPLVWNRDRTERLFDFRYRIEIYVPKPKRVFGYYVLPFLHNGDLVARVDLKAHRADGVLEVRGAYHEHDAEPKTVAPALRAELEAMTAWMGLDDLKVAERGNLAKALR